MLIIGIDAHKRTHTAVAIDGHGRQLASRTTQATASADHLELIRWLTSSAPSAAGRSRIAGTSHVAWRRIYSRPGSGSSAFHPS
jgi:hypothetical protein